jgi:glycerophosphoryl diester phosphodiesterase
VRRIGHRGAKGHALDNTAASFEQAVALGCDEVETDVWALDDGVFVIAHDRPSSREGSLSLDAVLDLCGGRMGVNVELKCEGSEAAARRTGALVAARIASRADPSVYVSSFWWSALEGARDAAPDVRRAYIYASSPARASLLADARALGLWALHPNRAYVTAELVRAAHDASLAVQPWTVNDPDEIARFRAWGVDGIMSDFPERVPKG